MSQSTILNDTTTYNSIMLNLLRLMAEYDTTLVQYNQATLDYNNYVKDNAATLNQLTQTY